MLEQAWELCGGGTSRTGLAVTGARTQLGAPFKEENVSGC